MEAKPDCTVKLGMSVANEDLKGKAGLYDLNSMKSAFQNQFEIMTLSV